MIDFDMVKDLMKAEAERKGLVFDGDVQSMDMTIRKDALIFDNETGEVLRLTLEELDEEIADNYEEIYGREIKGVMKK